MDVPSWSVHTEVNKNLPYLALQWLNLFQKGHVRVCPPLWLPVGLQGCKSHTYPLGLRYSFAHVGVGDKCGVPICSCAGWGQGLSSRVGLCYDSGEKKVLRTDLDSCPG